MSRQNRVGLPGGAVPPTATSGKGPGVPTPVALQAQQYLEENIKAWMQPLMPSATTREQMQQPPPTGETSSPAESYSAYSNMQHLARTHGEMLQPGTSSMTRLTGQEHNLSQHQPRGGQQSSGSPHYSPRVGAHPQHQPPVSSPSSGYSDSYNYLSLACDTGTEPQSHPSPSAPFPHSQSFGGGCSHHSLLQGTSYSTPCGGKPRFEITQPSAAASFFARAAQRLNLSTKKKKKQSTVNDTEKSVFRTNFCELLSYPPPIPPGLLRNSGRKDTGIGKVKVMLRMCPSGEASSSEASYMTVDNRKKQVTLYDPTICGPDHSGDRLAGVAAPKMFAFDAIFSPDDNQAEICSSSLCDVITSVVNGSDGCLFVYGNSKLGKTSTMVGSCNSAQELGIIPSAIWWLFRAINEHKRCTGARFSVRVSAVEVCGKVEELRDLLVDYAAGTEGSASAPGVYLRDDPVFGTKLMNQSELRAPTAERAAYLLDAALAARTSEFEEDSRSAHFLFTLHIYQYRVEKGGKGGVAGGRSRLHLFDLGSCEKATKSKDGMPGACLSLSALGNVILALFNGQKHVPYKESKLTQLLREAVGSVTCRAAMIAHVSTAPSRYPETLATLQLASRIHRLRRKKLKFPSAIDASTGADEMGVCRPFVRIHAVGEDGVKSGGSDPDYTSSSEQSCDTVIFVGSGRGTPVSPLTLNSTTSGFSKKQPSKVSHNQILHLKGQSHSSTKDDKTIEIPVRSALNSQESSVNAGITTSPKKKVPITSCYSTSKHQKLENLALSPKIVRYSSPDHSAENKKLKHLYEAGGNNSPTSKFGSADPLQRITPNISSTPSSPQSPRKSKRNHKPEGMGASSSPHSFQPHHQAQGSPAAKSIISKEPKLSSDEMWIDGPRFTKPKFDSRTLQQLQREKWVDGPGLYGYMDVQKETMIRKWVEDHSKIVPESQKKATKEVWIDFPKNNSEKEEHKSSKENPVIAEVTEKKIDPKITLLGQNEIQVEVEAHHYAKPLAPKTQQQPPYSLEVNSAVIKKLKKDNANIYDGVEDYQGNALKSSDDNVINSESDENSNCSVNLNDNENDDLSNKLRCISENDNSTFSRAMSPGSIDSTADLQVDNQSVDDDLSDYCDMVDSSIQVTEEDIFSSCGWPEELCYGGDGTYDGTDHPLRILSVEDLNLASSFTDSRAVSVDLDSISVPETWTGYNDEMAPDLTWRLLRGNSFNRYAIDQSTNDCRTFNGIPKTDILSAKLERLSRLREIFEKKANSRDCWKPSQYPKKTSELLSNEARFLFPNKLHHSADSSLEELRENDGHSIHSEPAEYDLDRVDFQFNVQPMNGLRLEAFYNKICKVPRFPECITQFGKPTQVVPPIVKQPISYAKLPFTNIKPAKDSMQSSKEKLVDDIRESPPTFKKRWSQSYRQPDGASDSELNKHSSITDLVSSKPATDQTETLDNKSMKKDSEKVPVSTTEQINRHSLVEIVHEQRCQVYSQGPLLNPHSAKQSPTNRASKTTKVITKQITNVVRNIEITELKNESAIHKRYSKKNGSPKLLARGISDSSNIRNNSSRLQRGNNQHHSTKRSAATTSQNSSPQHSSNASKGASSTSGVSNSISWTPSHPVGTLVNSPYVLQSNCDIGNESAFLKNNFLSRSASTPTSPFLSDESTHSWSNVDYSCNIGTPTYVCCTSGGTPAVTTVVTPAGMSGKKGCRTVRTSSSGHGSDSSVLSSDIKETKDIMGCIPKGQQFSGTSSGYESMPRDSEGTPHSSSSHESSSELGTKRENRGRKGAKKKSQGSCKRSRSVPARPPLPGSPSWQPIPQPTSSGQAKRARGLLVRDLQDPSLWKSEEDVCCTSLLCCRLLDFYST